MHKILSTLAYLAARGKKAIAAVVGAVAGAGGIAVFAPSLPPQAQVTITAVFTVLAVLCGPANAPKTTTVEKQEGTSQ